MDQVSNRKESIRQPVVSTRVSNDTQADAGDNVATCLLHNNFHVSPHT
jgi:hypothetical protein